MKQGAADEVKEVTPATPMEQKPAVKNLRETAGPGIHWHSESGTQKSLNPAKTQSRTMHHLRK